jgi:long-chain acyl-CoA synthetase
MAGETMTDEARGEAPWLKTYPADIDWHAPLRPRPLIEFLDAALESHAERPMVDFLGRISTYAEIGREVDKMARGLGVLGVGKGVKVGLFLPNCPLAVIAFFAALKAGGTVVNYNPLYAERELEHQIEDSETDLMVTLDLAVLLPKLAPLLEKTRLKTIIVGRMADYLPFPKSLLFPLLKRKDIAALPDDPAYVTYASLTDNDGRPPPVAIDPEADLALIQYTGGTTGVPKGAAHTHASLSVSAEQLVAWAPMMVPGEERILGVLPLFHVFALSLVLLLGARTGATMVLLPRFEMKQVLETIRRTRPTILPGVPTMYNAIASQKDIDRYDLTSIRLCISGGAPLPAEVKADFERRAGCVIAEGYGLTEAPVTHCNPLAGKQKLGSVGLPMPGTWIEIRSLDDKTSVMPTGESGEVCLKGPQLMSAYFQKPEESAATIRDGWLHTGDIGYLDQDGYCFLVDRLKEMIICSGCNVYPRVVEEALYAHPLVAEAAVIGVADAYRGETVKAYIVCREGAALDQDELKAFLKDRLSPMEMPKLVEFRSELPKSAVGKILKKELSREHREKADAAA